MITMNYFKLDYWLPRRSRYAYLDTSEYLADRIFVHNEIKVRFLNRELHHPKTDYIMIFCEIRSKDEPKFVESMDRLKANMILLGHDDYDQICIECSEIFGTHVIKSK